MTNKSKKTNDENIYQHPSESNVDVKIALLEQSIDTINKTLERIESSMNNQFNELKSELRDYKKEVKSDFRWILTIIAGLGAIMAHGFHWF